MVSFPSDRDTSESTLGLLITGTCTHHFVLLIQGSLADRVLIYSNLPMENSFLHLCPPSQLKTNPIEPKRKQGIKTSSPSWKRV